MKPMQGEPQWWPGELGSPSSSGAQNEVRYAFFPDTHRLAIDQGGRVTVYDSGEHEISGVQQQQGEGDGLSFNSQNGTVDLGQLRQLQ